MTSCLFDNKSAEKEQIQSKGKITLDTVLKVPTVCTEAKICK